MMQNDISVLTQLEQRKRLPIGAMMLMTATSLPTSLLHAAEVETTTLPAVTVKATAEQENKPTYQPTVTRVAKTLQAVQDIPQAVTTITEHLLEDQQASSFKDALKNVSGLTFNAAEGGRSGDNMMLRGFYTFGDIYMDGMRDTAQYNRETFNLDHIDVLRGSAAMLFGRGQAGGVINQTSKTPSIIDKNQVSTSIGDEGYFETTGDFNKTIDDDTAVRLNVMKRSEGSWRSNPVTGSEPDINREGVGISIAKGIGTNNETTLSHLYTKTKDNADYGISFDSATKRPTEKYPTDYFWGVDANFDDSTTHITTLSNQYQFTPQSSLHTQLRRAKYERAYWASAPSNTTAPDIDGNSAKTRQSDTENIALQSDFNTRLTTGKLNHDVLLGLEYLKEDANRWALQNIGTTASPFYAKGNFRSAATTYKGKSTAIFAQDAIEFIPHWKLLLGGRYDKLNAEYSSLTSPELTYSETSLRSGLSWQPTENSHYYFSYSDSFSPTADLYQLSGGSYPAERSKTLEIGTKWQFLDEALSLRTSVYTATKDWERNTDLESSAAILTKKRRTNGLEIEAAGNLTNNWELFSGLSLMDAEILEVAENRNATTGVITTADARLKGQKARNTPDYTFNLWTTYKVRPTIKIGGGIEAKGKRLVYSPSSTNANTLFDADGTFSPNTAPTYAKLDLMVAYEQPKWSTQLNIRNVLNKVYYDALYDNGGFAVPATKRAVVLTLKYKF